MKKKTRYKEIFKLKQMLEKEGIYFEFIERFNDPEIKKICPSLEHYQICYPSDNHRWISVIEGLGTYGAEQDLLEIQGGLTPEEEKEVGPSCIIGSLTAQNVFERIKNHYNRGENYE